MLYKDPELREQLICNIEACTGALTSVRWQLVTKEDLIALLEAVRFSPSGKCAMSSQQHIIELLRRARLSESF